MKRTKYIKGISFTLLSIGVSFMVGCSAITAQKVAGDGHRLIESGKVDDGIEKFKQSLSTKDNDSAHAGLAEAYLKQGRYSDAEKEINIAIKQAPTITSYNLTKAKVFLLQGQGPQAYESASIVVKDLAGSAVDPISKNTLKSALLFQARIIEATGKPDDALKILLNPDIQAKWPDDRNIKAEVAIVKALQQNYTEALSIADSVLKMSSHDKNALLAKGICLIASGKVDEAKSLIKDPLQDDHTRIMIMLQSARKLRTDNKTKESIALLELLSEVQPKNHLIFGELAFLYLDMQKYPESIKAHELTLQNHPAFSTLYSQQNVADFEKAFIAANLTEFDKSNLIGYVENLTALYIKLAETLTGQQKQSAEDKSFSYLERSIVIHPVLQNYQNLAAVYERKNEIPKSIAALEKVLALEPKNAEAWNSLGSLYLKNNQPQKAEESFKKAIVGRENDPNAYLNLGVVLYNAQKYKEAVSAFQDALKLKTDNPEIYFYCGISQMKSNDKKNAEQSLLKVIALKPDYADAYRELGNLAMEKKDYKSAEKYYNQEDKIRKGSSKKAK